MSAVALPTRTPAGEVKARKAPYRVMPGFNLSLGFTILYLTLIVLIPLSAIFLKTFTMTWDGFWAAVTSERVVASYKLTFGASFIGALLNVFFGGVVAWVLVRYQFPGKRIVDALVDLPFALPTAVAGITLTALYSSNGWFGQYIEGVLGIKVAFTPLGVVVALTFIGLPFVVRTVQPVLEDAERELEEAAASLGASAFQTFRRVVFPTILPSLLTGFAWPLPAPPENSAPSFSSPAICRWCPRLRRCSSSPSWSNTTTLALPPSPWSCWSPRSLCCWRLTCCRPGRAGGTPNERIRDPDPPRRTAATP